MMLTLKALIRTAADEILILIFIYFLFFFYFFIFFFDFSSKICLDVSCKSSAKQTIHMKYQDIFSLKNEKRKTIRMSSAINFAWCFKD